MSLRVLFYVIASPPLADAAISPSSVKYLQARGDCFVTTFLAMTWKLRSSQGDPWIEREPAKGGLSLKQFLR